ncbi:MAG: class I SAM-dependent methyltransferase [Phycisphaeraceae bacterium]|nr:class I SAM-dependent methyltransferase [Phycisphaeraceae bacterium]
MDRARFSALAHASHAYCNPVSGVSMEAALEHIEAAHRAPAAAPLASALDIACGKGELLVRLAERFAAPFRALGIDNSAFMMEEARARAAARGVGERISFRLTDAEHVVPLLPGGSFDFVSCIGSSHALLDKHRAMGQMARLVTPRGHVLLGEGYWRKKPEAEYLKALGTTEDEMDSHEANQRLGETHGLRLVWSVAASEAEWDVYENAYSENIERFARENPEDKDVPAMLERSRAWHALYRKHGRATMGFGVYLFRRE